MFYLIRTNLGTRTCINKNPSDIYTNNMNIGCGSSLPFPTNIQRVKPVRIRCTGASSTVNAEVFCDFMTAMKLNLV